MWEYEKPKKKITQNGLTVQRIRKRVKGRADLFSDNDIYYDKNDNKYYDHMHQEAATQSLTVETAEWDKCRTLFVQSGREKKNTIMAEAKQEAATKFIRFENNAGTALGNKKLQFAAIPFSEGIALRTEPKTIRLYAEGNMAHAHSLAQSLTTPENYSRFYHLSNTAPAPAPNAGTAPVPAPDADTTPAPDADTAPAPNADTAPAPDADTVPAPNTDPASVLIKATEFDSEEGVVRRYMDKVPEFQIDSIQNISPEQQTKFQTDESYAALAIAAYQEGANNSRPHVNEQFRLFYEAGLEAYTAKSQSIHDKINAAYADEQLEASFGTGRPKTTGDLSRYLSRNGSKRKYDIIQATFFWLPWGTNGQNCRALRRFFLNQRWKLKPGGKIRITLTNANRGRANGNIQNGYSLVADDLVQDPDITRYYDIRKIVLEDESHQTQKYSDKLTALGLNPAGFTHTQTRQNEEVRSNGDLVIEATRKDVTATSRSARRLPLMQPLPKAGQGVRKRQILKDMK